jgi:phosphomannomutase/phosphoglucomutase
MTAAMMARILVESGKPFSVLMDDLPQYTMMKEKIPTPHGHAILKNLEDKFSGETLDRTDGIKIVRDRTWALVRASGTEPLIRIMVESNRKKNAQDLYSEVRQAVENALKDTGESRSS